MVYDMVYDMVYTKYMVQLCMCNVQLHMHN